MSPLFDFFDRSDRNCRSESESLPARQNEGRRHTRYNQREVVDRPNRVMIVVVIGIWSQKLGPMDFDLCRVQVHAIKMGVHYRRMVVTCRGTRMNVLKRSHKKCQHQCQAGL